LPDVAAPYCKLALEGSAKMQIRREGVGFDPGDEAVQMSFDDVEVADL